MKPAYHLAAATKTILRCFACARLQKVRVGHDRQQIQALISDIGTAVEDVMRTARTNFENENYFRQWCLEKGEDWSSVAEDFNLFVQSLRLYHPEKYINFALYRDFNQFHADVQTKK